ncbi:hypothetical protein MAL08_02475 [Leptospira noguchii]|uniref:hypothetical protein n=1 Tax=Leptospira noguchii TaxID=28182 RepID=UPI001FB72AE2|nr:hypothetical protein [Leptospira noguchii]UOG38238.1 hypothetical protein MAL08_02475 [Leptospira noguchii]
MKDAINQMEKIVGLRPKEVYVLNQFLKLKRLASIGARETQRLTLHGSFDGIQR